MKRIPTPRLAGEYTRIYDPDSCDVYLGQNTAHYRYGEAYDKWTVNDFSVARQGDTYYMTGITHPTPAGLSSDGFAYVKGAVHEAEFQFFLSSAKGRSMGQILQSSGFQDMGKLLYPSERPDERPEAHAPHLMKTKDGWAVIYGPQEMRCAFFDEAFRLTDRRVLFTDEWSARDPFVFFEDGLWYIFYAVANRIQYRTSFDFVQWSEPVVLQINPFRNGASESPFVMKRQGFYYLFWSIWDDRNGSYDHRTFVFGAERMAELADTAPIAMLPAHAPEIVSDESGDWLLSAFYPVNGISAAPLEWI